MLTGRSVAPRPNLDNLFAVPGAAITLQTAMGLLPTGVGAVCFRAAEGLASSASTEEAIGLIQADGGPPVSTTVDDFGFTWLVVGTPAAAADGAGVDVSALVTDLHAVNSGLETQGLADGLLCSLVGFADTAGRKAALVYLYKQGSFYPFAQTGPQTRDVLLERQIRDAIGADLNVEPDPSRWLPVWGNPLT